MMRPRATMRRHWRRAVCILAAGILAIAAPAGTARANDPITVVAASTGFQVMATLAAIQMGYFTQQGLDVDLVLVDGGSKALAAVLGGDAQVYVGVPSSALTARARGADAVVFGSGFTQIGSNFVMSRDWAKSHGITEATPYRQKLAALTGITVGIQTPGDGTDQVLRFLAKDAGINPDRDMTIVALGNGEAMTAAFAKGRIQGFLQSAPVGENAIKNYGAIMFLNTARGEVKALDGFFYIGQLAQGAWLTSHSDIAVRYLRGLQLGLEALHDPNRTNAVRDKVYSAYYSKTDRQLYDATWASTLSAFPLTVEITDQQIQTVITFMNAYKPGSIDQATAAKAWTNVYAAKAVSGLKTP